ncbi:MAG: DUF3098 domain-containing protein [Salinivirgaceae bacterium]|jgi:hypothetical protein|nr:DUF3098 domain-containing protein [Bacteroidales bacterium]
MKEEDFAISRKNARLLLLGFGIVVLGFILMIGGAPSSPEVWYPNNDPSQTPEMFSFVRITLAPIIVIAGFVFNIWVIMRDQTATK